MARSLYSLQTSCIDNYSFASGYGEQAVLSGTVAFSDPDLNGFWLISPRGNLMKPSGFSRGGAVTFSNSFLIREQLLIIGHARL